MEAPLVSSQPAAASDSALLAGTSAGSRLFLAGLAGLVVTVVGLVMVFLRRRQY